MARMVIAPCNCAVTYSNYKSAYVLAMTLREAIAADTDNQASGMQKSTAAISAGLDESGVPTASGGAAATSGERPSTAQLPPRPPPAHPQR
jgi:hypothetical protein